MKKFIIAAAMLLTTEVLVSQTKLADTAIPNPSTNSKSPLSSDSKELASGD